MSIGSTSGGLAPDDRAPAAAVWLGGAGLLPFLAGAAVAWIAPDLLGPPAATILIGYAAIILSFLGGTLWGLAAAPAADNDRPHPAAALVFGIAVVPSLAAWACLLADGRAALAALAGLFVLHLAADRWVAGLGLAPGWWMTLRLRLTLVAVPCLLAAAAA